MVTSKLSSSASFEAEADGTSSKSVLVAAEGETSETIQPDEQPGSMKDSNVESRINDKQEHKEDKGAVFLWGVQIPQQFARYTWHVTVVLAGMIIIAPRRFFFGVIHLVLTTIGVTLGIGLGLGLAMHVYEQLQSLHRAHHHETKLGQGGQAAGTTPTQPNTKRMSKKGNEGGSSFGGGAGGGGAGGGPMMTESMTRSKQGGSSSILEDGNTYLSLMAASGYYMEDKILRAQVVRANADFWKIRYPFTGVPVQQQKGALLLQEDWPSLPHPITVQLGRFVEHVMRDYVSTWYSKMDAGCVYRDERDLRAKGEPRDGGDDPVGEERNEVSKEEGTALRDEGGSAPTTPSKKNTDAQQQHLHLQRLMVFSTQRHRRSPMLDQTYRVLSVAFGNLATRAEHVNIFSLAMLKWTQVLAHTFKVYRTLRKAAMDKNVEAQKRLQNNGTGGNTSNSTNLNRNKAAAAAASFASAAMNVNAAEPKPQPPTEVQVAREFLLAGKLHCAVTFGLDLPSLLFADATGQECGTGTEVTISATTSATSPTKTPSSFSKNDKEIQDKILAERLFQTTMLKECELDYNRVVAYRLCRALLPRTEFASTVLSSLVVEIFSGCVLQPLMGIFTPVYLNGWIIAGMAKKKASKSAAAADNEKNEKTAAAPKPPPKVKVVVGSDEAAATTKETSIEVSPGLQEEVALSDELSNENKTSVSGDATFEDCDVLDDPLPTPLELDLDDDGFAGGQYIDDEEEDDEVVDVLEGEGSEGLAETESADKLLTLAAMTLIQLQQKVDFELCRMAKLNHQEVGVNWDDPTCQVWVVRLVLILEAAVLNGRCKYVESNEEAKVMDDSVDKSRNESGDIADETPMYDSLSQVLMELTADIDGFESRVDEMNKERELGKKSPKLSTMVVDYEPEPSEISTLRTLISTWLHTGQLYRSLSVLIKAHGSFLSAFYSPSAFLANPNAAEGFVRQMKLLDGVDVMVDTMAVLASARLDPEQTDDSIPTMLPSRRRSMMETPSREGPATALFVPEARNPLGGRLGQGFGQGLGMLKTNIANRLAEQQQPREQQQHRESQQEPPTTPTEMAAYMSDLSTPRHLDFSRNAAFASSLRDERERRMRSWETRKADTTVQTVHRKGASAADIDLHTELHSVARIFYNGTNIMAIRDAARRKDSEESDPGGEGNEKDGQSKVSLLTVEMVSNRRRIEVPDDDSSFLLRAQVSWLSKMISSEFGTKSHMMLLPSLSVVVS
jgi:hypothetical protein